MHTPCTSPALSPSCHIHHVPTPTSRQSLNENPTAHSQILRGKAKSGSTSRIIKDDELRLEEDVTEDGLSDAGIALETTEAAPAFGSGGVVHEVAGHNGRVAFDLEGQIGEGGAAREDVSTVGLAVGRSRHLRIVVRHEVVGQEEKRSSRVSDGGDALADGRSGADRVSAAGKAPEALGVVHRGVGDVASVLARVNVAKVVATGLTLPQVGGEERRVEAGLGVGKEGPLLIGLDRVDRAEGETEEAVTLVLSELRADPLCQFNGLSGDGCSADIDDIGVNVTAG